MNFHLAARRWSSFVALSVAIALAPGCKPKAGGACAQGQGACTDGTTMMACVKGTFAVMPCHGATGCATSGKVAQCDNTLASVGDVCDEPGDYACQMDMKAALSCKDFKWTVEETCRGASACTLKKDGLTCDNDVSDQGDPCHTNGDYACTSDKVMALRCVNNVMTPLNACRGVKGCRVHEMPEQKKIEFVCDDALAMLGDPCDENGEEACTMDKKALLKCANNKFAAHASCPGGCSFDANGEHFTCEGGAPGPTTPVPPAKTKNKGK
jgi:hypothetical protein